MGQRKEKITDAVYTVQSETNSKEMYNFPERPILCETMETITGVEWSKDTLDYHFSKKQETEFSYRGYMVFMRTMYRGRSRGRYSKT
jgi:hypothetical protein